MGEPEDREFAREMREARRVSRAYRQLGQAQPPAELDARITQHARAVLPPTRNGMREIGKPAPSRHGWLAPFTLAASVLLSAALLLSIAMRPAQRNAEPPVRLMHAVAPLVPKRHLYSTDPPGSHPPAPAALPPMPVEVIRRDPREWQAYIKQLESQGRDAEARQQRRAFQQTYPELHDAH